MSLKRLRTEQLTETGRVCHDYIGDMTNLPNDYFAVTDVFIWRQRGSPETAKAGKRRSAARKGRWRSDKVNVTYKSHADRGKGIYSVTAVNGN